MVERMRGMFAFAIWDARARTLTLGRDRLGIKPLFYAVTPDALVVASEIKAIVASGLVAPRIDREALDDLFSLGYPCPPRTMFEGVRELRPGHVMIARAREGVHPPRRYWRAPFVHRGEHREASAQTHAEELRAVLVDATRTHLVSDVPLGAALSGGLDSSAIAALAKQVAGQAPTTFSIRFDDPRFDESRHARAVREHLGATSHEVLANGRAAELLPEMIRHLELPLLVPGAIGGLLLSRLQREVGVRVALTGDGADELLGGYDVFRAAKVRRSLDGSWLRFARPTIFGLASMVSGQPRGLAAMVDRDAEAEAEIAHAFGGVRPPWYDAWQLLDVERAALLSPDGPDGRRVRPIHEPPEGFTALVRDDVADLDPLDADLALEFETRLPSWILIISDRSSMANGVEARVPFLDDRVVETMVRLPPSMKMRGLREKAILRDAIADLLPRSIRRRRKQPFMTPIAEWFFHPGAPPFVEDAMSTQALRDEGLFAPDVVAKLRRALEGAPAHHVTRVRLELVLMLVLGTQLLARSFRALEV
jgi:asparagine synthase (glutamine-hydrolysing)